jgi:hypothetical protein
VRPAIGDEEGAADERIVADSIVSSATSVHAKQLAETALAGGRCCD